MQPDRVGFPWLSYRRLEFDKPASPQAAMYYALKVHRAQRRAIEYADRVVRGG